MTPPQTRPSASTVSRSPYCRAVFFQVSIVPLSPNPYVLFKFIFHTLTLTFFDGALMILTSKSSTSSVGLFYSRYIVLAALTQPMSRRCSKSSRVTLCLTSLTFIMQNPPLQVHCTAKEDNWKMCVWNWIWLYASGMLIKSLMNIRTKNQLKMRAFAPFSADFLLLIDFFPPLQQICLTAEKRLVP